MQPAKKFGPIPDRTDPPDRCCNVRCAKRPPPMPNWRPSARIEKPCDHQETKSPSIKAHIDARDEPSSDVQRHFVFSAAPARLACCYIHTMESQLSNGSAQSMPYQYNISLHQYLNKKFTFVLHICATQTHPNASHRAAC